MIQSGKKLDKSQAKTCAQTLNKTLMMTVLKKSGLTKAKWKMEKWRLEHSD